MPRITLDGDDRDFLEWRSGSGGTVEILDIAVGSERGKGRGRRLVELLFKEVGPDVRVWAITTINNEVAQQFYEHLQFSCAGVLRRFYSKNKGADAVMYVRGSEGPV